MPYKDSEAKKKHDRDDKRRKRGTTNEGDDRAGTTVEMFNRKPRYLKLSDGQVLDRTYQPEPNKHLPEMAACNRETDLSRGMSKAKRLAVIMRALDRDVTGLDGKRVTLGSMVRYGVSGPTMDEVRVALH